MNILENLLECPFPTLLSFAGLFPNYRRVINRKQRELKELEQLFPEKVARLSTGTAVLLTSFNKQTKKNGVE